jgi:hypothetical protein
MAYVVREDWLRESHRDSALPCGNSTTTRGRLEAVPGYVNKSVSHVYIT